MTLTDFFAAIEADDQFRGVDITDQMATIYDLVRKQLITVPVSTVMAVDWKPLRSVLATGPQPLPLYQFARIVGYFSRVENWNPGKLGELRDRRAGDYRLPEASPPAVPELKAAG